MFERFSDPARRVVVDAQQQARRLGHDHIGCAHMLLALASSEDEIGDVFRQAGLTAASVESAVRMFSPPPPGALDREALAAIGIDLAAVEARIKQEFGPGALAPRPTHRRWHRRRRQTCAQPSGHLPLEPSAKKCLELSLREAVQRRDGHIGPEHIALALTHIDDGPLPKILNHLGVTPSRIRSEISTRYRRAG